MKYLSHLMQIIICCLASLCLTGLMLLSVFVPAFTQGNFVKYMKTDKYIAAQKLKLQHDIDSISLASGIDSTIFKGAITDSIIIENNTEYINGIFDYLNGKTSVFIKSTNASMQYEQKIKTTLTTYSAKLETDNYTIMQNGINQFAGIQKVMFFENAAPFIGFSNILSYLRLAYKGMIPLLYACMIGAVALCCTLLIFNKGRKYISVAYMLNAASAAGILSAVISGIGLWLVTAKSTIIHSFYLQDVVRNYCSQALIIGIAVFVITQVALAVLMVKIKKKQTAN